MCYYVIIKSGTSEGVSFFRGEGGEMSDVKIKAEADCREIQRITEHGQELEKKICLGQIRGCKKGCTQKHKKGAHKIRSKRMQNIRQQFITSGGSSGPGRQFGSDG